MHHKLHLELFGEEHSFNDYIVEAMTPPEQIAYLLECAIEFLEVNEPEVAYGVLHELVWRAPRYSAEVWKMLAETAARLGYTEQARAAQLNYEILLMRTPPGEIADDVSPEEAEE